LGATAVAATALLLFFVNASAAVNPALLEQELRSRASEALTVDIVAVDVDDRSSTEGTIEVAASAVVRQITKTHSSLKAGDVILIRYTLDVARLKLAQNAMAEKAKTGWAGQQLEGLPAVVEAGGTYQAFLSKRAAQIAQPGVSTAAGAIYTPASAGASFERVKSAEAAETPP
jgi:hypothetical protein